MQRTQLLNGLRGHLTEVGVIAPQGLRCARELAELIEACDETIPFEVCEALAPLVVQLRNLDEAIAMSCASERLPHPGPDRRNLWSFLFPATNRDRKRQSARSDDDLARRGC